MRTQHIKKIVAISTIILGLILASFSSISIKAMTSDVDRNTRLAPQGDIVYSNNTEPVIDGDLESYTGEWENATVQTQSIGTGGNIISITTRVQSNSTHLFMGISYTTETFEDYNPDTNHTWFAVAFDNNFDSRIGYSNDTIDDGVAVNFKQLGAQDVYFNGTTIYSMVADDNVTGVENSVAVLDQYLDDFNRHVVTIEIAKELNSMDEAGNDIELFEGETLRYLLILFQNKTAVYNHSLLFNRVSNWKSFTLHPTYDYFSYEEELASKSVLTYISESEYSEEGNLTVINNIIDSYGFNNTLQIASYGYEFTFNGIKSYDLIILIGALDELTEEEIDAIRFYTSSGGSLYVLGEVSNDDDPVNDLLMNFGLQIYNSTVNSEDIGVNSTITLDTGDITDLPYLTDSTIMTDKDVSTIFYQGSAFNFTMNGTFGEMVVQFQEADLYATLNKSGEYYVDLDDNRMYNNSLDYGLNDSAVFQAALELQRGGKLIATASADIFNSTNILKEDNKHLLIRQLQWLFNLQHQISYENFVVEETVIDEGGEIHVQITVYGDNDTTIDNLRVWVVILELKADRNQEDLMTIDNSVFNGTISPIDTIKANFVDVNVRMHKRGYGYNETQLVEVFMDPDVGKQIKLDVLAMILFFVSIGLVVLGGFATRGYKGKEEEA
ncbi:MAG: hypothetical protein ACTSQF_04410 [Candidatus Heimdallarchaeaceae archaeon]